MKRCEELSLPNRNGFNLEACSSFSNAEARGFPVWIIFAPVASAIYSLDLEIANLIIKAKIGAKIAKAHSEKLPYMLVVGPKEAQSNTVNVRIRGDKETKTAEIDKFITIAKRKIADKKIELVFEDR